MKSSIVFLVAFVFLITGCSGISDGELSGLESTVKRTFNSESFKFEAEKVSEGEVSGKSAKLVRVKYTDPAMKNPRQCIYALYHHDKDAGLLTDLEFSLPNRMDGTCSVKSSCFGCGEAGEFESTIRAKGYTGKIYDL